MLKLKLKKKKEDAGRNSSKAEPSRPTANNPQGITANGNALLKVTCTGLAIVLVTLVLAFAYLLLLREPGTEQQQADRVASSFAEQQATNIHRLISQMRTRVASAAQSPLALSAIASRSRNDIEVVEQAMLDYFPEVISLHIIPLGDMGTAEIEGGSEGLRNHIEVDLVRRTSEGQQTQPESYQFEESWLTSIAELITHPRIGDRRAVIIVTLDNNGISNQLRALETASGRFTLEQMYTSSTGVARTDIIASSGSGGVGEYTRYATIPESSWRVAFTPSAAMMDRLNVSAVPIYAVLALCVLAAIAAFILVLNRTRAVLQEDINRMISAADRKSELQLAIPELVGLARQLRRATLRALRQGGAASAPLPQMEVETLGEPNPAVDSAPPSSEELADLMFQTNQAVESGEEFLELDLEEAEDLSSAEPGFPNHIFRAYDIRGLAEQELTDELVTRIGHAIGSIAGEMDEQALIIGCDGRSSSPRIKSSLIRALMESGRDVIDIGLVPTPVLYFATRHLDCRSGIMITGSHNPADHNGLKIVLNQHTIAAGGIENIRQRVLQGDFSRGNGRMIKEDVLPAYTEEIFHDIAIAVPLKIVIDAGNGATSDLAPKIFEELGCEIVPMFCQVDGTFPNHPPDTSNEDNLFQLVEAVQRENADFGVAFDGDGDRLAVVTGSGRIVRSDLLLMIFAQDIVSRNPGADVVFDVKCSRNLTQLITRHGGRPVLWKTGHAFMKEKMAETGALLGGEFSGHIFFGERWYGFDDGIYAAGRLAEILSTQGDSLDDIIDTFPATVNTPEILIPVSDQDKHRLVERIVRNTDFSSGKVNTMDGIRVDFAEGWGLVRASNTSAALTARFEADTTEGLEMIMSEFREQIALVEPGLKLGF